ncbi:MAG: response regulator [Desulfovibrio sp.]|nr:response regulator [Desulfovibrio sp.]
MKAKELLKTNYHQILLVFMAFLTMVLVSYFYVSNIVQRQMQIIGDASMDITQTAVSASLMETELLFANVVQTMENMLATGETNQELLVYLRETNTYFNAARSPLPDFMKVYAYVRGEWLDGSGWVPPPDFVPESRPWHIGAENNNGRIFFSEPYIDAETGEMCISFSQKLFDYHGKAHGILAVDLRLTRITNYVRDQRIAGNGYGVLIGDRMNFIVHRNPDLPGRIMSEAGGDYPRLAEMFSTENKISAVRFNDEDGTDSVIYFRPIFQGWHIGVIIPRVSYYSEVFTLAAVLGVLGLFLASILCYLLIRSLAAKVRSEEESLSKSTFLARMSHEMRTPMNAIIGMADIAQMSTDPGKMKYCLTRISDASNHLLGVINDVLDMSKIEAGKLELSETDFTVAGLLRQVETVIAFKIEEKQQRFTVEVDRDVPRALVADRQRLAQVITNLLSNANKFTPKGGDIALWIRRLPDDGNLCVLRFEVQDSGIGISQEQQPKLFQSFEQADGSISRKYGGTGLGLAISKRIVEMMGGKISIESEPGRGSTFIFTARVREGVAAPDAEHGENLFDPNAGQGRIFAGNRLLLAEDVEINREILITLLENTGVQIDIAENGREACDMFAAAQEKYDMIFMDIHMPEMDGYEATRCIRGMNLPRAGTIPIVAMTANVFREDIEKCRACGMDDHVGKPLEKGEVLAKMRIYMNAGNRVSG